MRAEDTVLRRRATARALRNVIEERRIPQNLLARRAGISESSLSTYLSGQTLPGEPKLWAIAEAIGIDLVKLWEEITQCEVEVVSEISASETREGKPAVPYEGSGGEGIEASMRRLIREIATELIEELKAEGILPGREG